MSWGYEVEGEALEKTFARFKELADRKKTVTDRDIEALVFHPENHRDAGV